MTAIRLGALARCWNGSAYNGLDADRKARFHATGVRRMRKLAELIGLPPGTYDVRSNKGGMAVSGEVTLHGEGIYVQASVSCVNDAGVLVRTCDGRRDYSGHVNHWVKGWDCLDPHDSYRRMTAPLGCLESLAYYCRALIDKRARENCNAAAP